MEMEPSEVCPYIGRMGVCLEPAACSLKHKTMNLNAKEFVPGGGNIPDYVPGEQDYTQQDYGGAIEKQKFGEDDEFGIGGDIYFLKERENCTCCRGYVNNCSGDACANLGVCYCTCVDEEDR